MPEAAAGLGGSLDGSPAPAVPACPEVAVHGAAHSCCLGVGPHWP